MYVRRRSSRQRPRPPLRWSSQSSVVSSQASSSSRDGCRRRRSFALVLLRDFVGRRSIHRCCHRCHHHHHPSAPLCSKRDFTNKCSRRRSLWVVSSVSNTFGLSKRRLQSIFSLFQFFLSSSSLSKHTVRERDKKRKHKRWWSFLVSFSSSFVLLFSEADDVNDDNNNNESRESREYYKVYIKADSSLLSCGPLEFSKTLNNRAPDL